MSTIEKSLILEALKQYGRIEPCSGRSYESSFTKFKDKILFWFNDKDHSTRVIEKSLY